MKFGAEAEILWKRVTKRKGDKWRNITEIYAKGKKGMKASKVFRIFIAKSLWIFQIIRVEERDIYCWQMKENNNSNERQKEMIN